MPPIIYLNQSSEIKDMNRLEGFKIAKELAVELGFDVAPLKLRWRTSTAAYWRNIVKKYRKNIKNRDNRYNRALKISRETGVPLSIPSKLSGTDQNIWDKEVKRLQAQKRRNLGAFRKAQIRKKITSAILPKIKNNQLLTKKRQIKRLKKIKIDLRKSAKQMMIRQFKVKRTPINRGERIEYIHSIPKYIESPVLRKLVGLRINEQNFEEIRRLVSLIVNIHRKDIGSNRFQITINERTNTLHPQSTSHMLGIKNTISRFMTDVIRPIIQNYEDELFDIGRIIISIFKNQGDIMGASSTRSIEQANHKWHIVNPTSKFNCVFQSIAVCRNFNKSKLLLEDTDEASKKRIISGLDLKTQVKPSNDNYADNMTIQEISNYTKHPIHLYNNVFEKIKTFIPKNPLLRYRQKVKYYSIQKVGDHCKALVDKKIIKYYHNDFNFNVIRKVSSNLNNENKIINKKKCFHKYNEKIASWDIETSLNYKKEHIPYASAIAWFDYEYGTDTITYVNTKKIINKKEVWKEKEIRTKNIVKRNINEKQFWGLNCLQELTKWIYNNKAIFNGYTLYAHNGAKYDLPLAIKKAFIESPDFLMEGKGCVELNNAWIGFTLRARTDRKYKIYFRDSYRLLPMGLQRLTEELKVKHQKLSETVKHSDITLLNYNTFPQLKKYLTHDVFGLLEVIQKFGENVFKELSIDITKCFTGASLSKINFFKNYYDISKPVYKLSDYNDKFIRDSYFGGRVECFKMGNVGKSYYYDFTSLYPDVGRKYLPYGEPEILKLNKAKSLPKDFFGWVECLVKTKNTKEIPKHCMISDHRLIFPVFENWTSINLFSEELDFDQYDYEFITGVKFKKAQFKKKFFNDGFNKKAESKKNNNPAMTQAYKIIINSGYGFWGLRTKGRDGVIICEPNSNKYMDYLNTDKLISIRETNDYVFCRVLKDLDVKDFNVGVAAAISSYARSKLHSLLKAIRKVGGELYYCDTDSVICNININDYPEIKNKFQWDGKGDELGSLKNEADDYMKKTLKKIYKDDNKKQKEVFNELLKKENGNFSWDVGVITGCKQYALSKTITVEGIDHVMDIVKIKGYSQKKDKLKFEDMVNMNLGVRISQSQTQFRCPKSNYISETSEFNIKTIEVKKSFRRCYTKGEIFQDDVLPLRV